ncbi:helix-turn-helix domain-containing protein [Streptomyces hirsutus]|uniref:helix-turn-helix domain-containing protein n=1 Tax=Streptomyces hirsutus TaxID=35620 RepID=UPI001980D0F3
MAVRRPLTLKEREEIAVGRARDEGVREIARRIGRDPSVVSREIRRTVRGAVTGPRPRTVGPHSDVGALNGRC